MAANTTNYGSTIANKQTGSAIDQEILNSRACNDGSYADQTTPACDFSYQNLTASGNTLVKTGSGTFRALICGTATGNITIYDGTSTAGQIIYGTAALAVGVTIFEVSFGVGLFVVLSGAGVATVTFR